MSRTAWAWMRVAGGVAVLLAVACHVGAGPFVHGLRGVSLPAVLLAVVITAVVTAAGALRWRLVARGLGSDLPLDRAIAACYRSQFLNSALPGGVLGDVHRGVDHGRATADLGRGLRSVAWERTAGQAVQVLVTVAVLAALASPVRDVAPVLVAAVVATGVGVLVLVRSPAPQGDSRLARIRRTARTDVRDALLAHHAWPGVTLLSLVVVAGHLAVFVVAARTVGVHAGVRVLIPLALLTLVAAAVPANVGGWGPREGVAAWAFAAAGLGAGAGLAVATAFGVLGFLASLPGAVVLVAGSVHRGPLPVVPQERVLVGAGRG